MSSFPPAAAHPSTPRRRLHSPSPPASTCGIRQALRRRAAQARKAPSPTSRCRPRSRSPSFPEAPVSPPDRGNAEARGEGQIAAWLSYLLPGPAARGLSHTLGKRIGSRHGIPHGVTSCLLLPHVIRFLGPRKPEALERLRAGLGPDPAAAIADLVARLGLPQHLSQWKLTESVLQDAVAPLAGKS